MARFGPKTSKGESIDKTPYTIYYPHTIPITERKWTQPYYQVISIDPARKNYAFRIERRYHNGWIAPVVFDKTAIDGTKQEGDTTVSETYELLTAFLDKYQQFYNDCHFVIIERQLPQNYKATRIAQHSISYFSIRLHNLPLLPAVIEVDPKLKGKILGAPKNITDKQLKTWAIEKARELLTIRKDTFSLGVLDHFRNKQDDLSDTVCQAEAVFICWGFPNTQSPPSGPDNTPQAIKPITLQLVPPSKIIEADLLTLREPVVPRAVLRIKPEIPQQNIQLNPSKMSQQHIQLAPSKVGGVNLSTSVTSKAILHIKPKEITPPAHSGLTNLNVTTSNKPLTLSLMK